jgi:helicase MOV-10
MDATCTFNHDVYVCLPCGVVARSDAVKRAHLNSIRHRKRLEGRNQPLRCPLCAVMLSGSSAWSSHLHGRKHLATAHRIGVSPNVDPEEAGGQVHAHVYCSTCETYVHEDAWARHPQGRLHQLKVKFGAMRAAFQEAAKDKHGVTVSQADGVDFGIIDLSGSAKSCSAEVALEISLNVPSSSVFLAEAKLSPAKPSRRASP